MIVSRLLKQTLIAMTSVGILLPSAALAANPGQARAVIRDVALEEGGVLHGQVITAQGAVQPKTEVALLQNGKLVAKLLTDEQGRFATQGLRAGLYVVATPGAQGVVRAWAPRTAPPSAVRGLLLVPSGEVVNGIFGHDVWGWFHGDPEALRKALIMGGVIGVSGLIGGIIGYNNVAPGQEYAYAS